VAADVFVLVAVRNINASVLMTKPGKKDFEKMYYRILRDQCYDLPPTEPEHDDRPDFVWLEEARPLGMEITRLFQRYPRAQNLHARGSEREIAVHLAQRIFEERNSTLLDVKVFFSEGDVLKSQRHSMARSIAETVLTHIPITEGRVRLENGGGEIQSLPYAIHSLHITRFNWMEESLWSVPGSAWVQSAFVNELQDQIERKNEKIQEYLKKCARCWLVVGADGYEGLSFSFPGKETIEYVYRSLFERTFFIEIPLGKVHELRTMPYSKDT
jgi:hypothetical protein